MSHSQDHDRAHVNLELGARGLIPAKVTVAGESLSDSFPKPIFSRAIETIEPRIVPRTDNRVDPSKEPSDAENYEQVQS